MFVSGVTTLAKKDKNFEIKFLKKYFVKSLE
jgi:hypothetical protein